MDKHVPPLERIHRTIVFYLLLLLFVVVVPLLAFYANGYRYDFFSEEPVVTVTGGMYISTQIPEIEIFINELPAQKSRFFRRATFVQGLQEGVHRVHVQGQELHTWVKPVPVYSQMVTELFAFTLPVIPQVRLITPEVTEDGTAIADEIETLLTGFGDINITNEFSTSSQSTLGDMEVDEVFEQFLDQEFLLLKETIAEMPIITLSNDEETPAFRFSTTSPEVVVVDMATTTVTSQSGISLQFDEEEEVLLATYAGDIRSIPYYFCIPEQPIQSIAKRYGDHVAQALEADASVSTTTVRERGSWNVELCRSSIAIDTRNESVLSFNFVPGFDNLVVLHLSSGVYVTEIDDRGWQNHQLLFPQNDGQLMIINNQIFLEFEEFILELLLEFDDN